MNGCVGGLEEVWECDERGTPPDGSPLFPAACGRAQAADWQEVVCTRGP